MGGTIGEHFDAIDTDRDGRITFAELFYAAELTPGEGVPPAHAGHGGRSGKAAVEKAWHEMSEEEQRAFETLGWNEKSWEAADNSPCCKGWYTMSDEERRASQLVGLSEEDFSREVYQRYSQIKQSHEQEIQHKVEQRVREREAELKEEADEYERKARETQAELHRKIDEQQKQIKKHKQELQRQRIEVRESARQEFERGLESYKKAARVAEKAAVEAAKEAVRASVIDELRGEYMQQDYQHQMYEESRAAWESMQQRQHKQAAELTKLAASLEDKDQLEVTAADLRSTVAKHEQAWRDTLGRVDQVCKKCERMLTPRQNHDIDDMMSEFQRVLDILQPVFTSSTSAAFSQSPTQKLSSSRNSTSDSRRRSRSPSRDRGHSRSRSPSRDRGRSRSRDRSPRQRRGATPTREFSPASSRYSAGASTPTAVLSPRVVELDIRGIGDFGIDFGVRAGRGGVKPLEISGIRPG